MTQEDKNKFDWLNQTSYLLRLLLNKYGFEIEKFTITNNDVWHVFYDKTIVGSITFRTDEENFTYCNLRLYKYFSLKFPKIKDFIMSEYFEFEDGKRVRFKFDDFEEYINKVLTCVNSLIVKQQETPEEQDDLSDSISRLKEYCEEYDSKFSNNIMFKDIRNILNENQRLLKEIEKLKASAER
jgi:hypothetical protein